MAAGQTNLVQLLSKSEEEEFNPIFFIPITKAISRISGFENNSRKEIFILRNGFISLVNNFFTHSPPNETH